MTTISQRALEKRVHKEMLNPKYAVMISGYLRNITDGRYDPLLVAAVFQKDQRQGEMDIFDAHAFATVHAKALQGEILSCSIPTPEPPRADAAVEENNAILVRVPDFHAVFEPDRGRNANDDGHISWDFELGLYTTVVREDGAHENWKYWIAPDRAPLEVGTTTAGRTLLHLAEEGRVCRWPYYSKQMLLLVNTTRAVVRSKELVSTTPCTCELTNRRLRK